MKILKKLLSTINPSESPPEVHYENPLGVPCENPSDILLDSLEAVLSRNPPVVPCENFTAISFGNTPEVIFDNPLGELVLRTVLVRLMMS